MRSSRALAPIMVGRQLELRDLEECLSWTRSRRGTIVFVAGDAGIGKSRLIREFLLRTRSDTSIQTLGGHCFYESPAIPYGPFIEAIRTFAQEHDAATIARVLGPRARDLTSFLPELEALTISDYASAALGTAKHRLFDAIYHFIRPWNAHTCRVVVLEDLHWSDTTSRSLIHYLANAITNDAVLIVGTYRSEAVPGHQPLTRLISELTRDQLYHEVRLAPLSHAESTSMLEITIGQLLPSRFAEMMYEHTEGNPFFLEEILKSLMEDDKLGEFISRFGERGNIDRFEVPVSIRDNIMARTSNSDSVTHEVLNYAAVIGRRFDFALLLHLTGLDETQLLRSVEQMVALQLVIEETIGNDDVYSFRHSLTRKAIYESMLARERRTKHRQVLNALEDIHRHNLEPVVDRLAYHSLRAGETERAGLYARMAAEKASRVSAHREAQTHYQVAYSLTATQDTAERASMLDKMALSALPLGDVMLCLKYWTEAQALFEQLGNNLKAGDIRRKLARIYWESGDTRAAFDSNAAAIKILEAEPPSSELAAAYSSMASISLLASQPKASLRWSRKAIALADAHGYDDFRAATMLAKGAAMVDAGNAAKGIRYLENCAEMCRRADMRFDQARAYLQLGVSLSRVGEMARSAECLRAAMKLTMHSGYETLSGFLMQALSSVELELGNWAQARELVDEAIRRGESGFPRAKLDALWVKADLLQRQGLPAEALKSLEDADVDLDNPHKYSTLRELLSLLAQIYLSLGEPDRAISIMDKCFAHWCRRGSLVGDERMLGRGIEIYLKTGLTTRAGELLEGLSSLAVRVRTPLARAYANDALGMMAANQGNAIDGLACFRLAATRWRDVGMPYQEAKARIGAARCLFKAGMTSEDIEEVRAELVATRESLQRLGAAGEVAQVDTLYGEHELGMQLGSATGANVLRSSRNSRAKLTGREIEVLRLVAQGMSNQQIASSLILSEHTIHRHMANILFKLDLSTRAAAVAYASRHDLL